jgi:hypothetical protein
MKMVLFLLFFSTSLFVKGQLVFQKVFGSSFFDFGSSVQQTRDTGYIIAGITDLYDTLGDICLIKLDSSGDTLWTKIIGNTGQDYSNDVFQTFDNGYVIVGETKSFGTSSLDLLIKTDSVGNIIWTKTYSGNKSRSIIQTPDSGFIFTGESAGGDCSLRKVNRNGDLVWAKDFGGASQLDEGFDLKQTSDGGFIIVGVTYSFPLSSYNNVYLIKTDGMGNLLWSKSYGGNSWEFGFSVNETHDGGYILSGNTYSFGIYSRSGYIIKTDTIGNIVWSKVLSGVGEFTSIMESVNGGYIAIGDYSLFDQDYCILKIDSLGSLIWISRIGGSLQENCYASAQTFDGGFILLGLTKSFGFGDWDMYLVKTDTIGQVLCNQDTSSVIFSNDSTQTFTNTSSTTPSIVATNRVMLQQSGISFLNVCTSLLVESNTFNTRTKIFPNPFHTTAKIGCFEDLDAGEKSQLTIYNSIGVLVREEKISNLNSYILHRDELRDGLYFYELQTRNHEMIGSGKFVVE